MTIRKPIPVLSVVELLPGCEAHGFVPGSEAVVLEIYHSPSLAYEVEVVGESTDADLTRSVPAEAVKVIHLYKGAGEQE